MEKYQLFTLIFSGITAASTIAAFLTCYFTHKSTKPNISFFIKTSCDKNTPQNVYSSFKKEGFCFITFEVYNNSPVSGAVSNLCLIFQGKEYYPEAINKDNKLKDYINIVALDDNGSKFNAQHRFVDPIIAKPFLYQQGHIVFPKFPYFENASKVKVVVKCKISGKIFQRRISVWLSFLPPLLSE